MLKIFERAALAAILFFSGACSLYESDGRKVIAENQNGIVAFTGLGGKPTHFFSCAAALEAPDVIKAPLEVIETEHEARGYSSFYNSHDSRPWIAVYTQNETGEHLHCKVYLVKNAPAARAQLLHAVQIGVDKIAMLKERLAAR